MSRRLPRVLTCLLVFALLAAASRALAGDPQPEELYVPLTFKPTKPITKFALPPTSPLKGSVTLWIEDLTDGRSGNPKVIGEARDKERAATVLSDSPVAAFVNRVFFTCVLKWDVPMRQKAPLVLRGRITKFWVSETNRFNALVSIRFSLTGKNGELLYERTVNGSGSVWGRSMKADNYQESLSDATVQVASNIFSDPAFDDALNGKASPPVPEAEDRKPAVAAPGTTTLPELKEALLKLQKEGFGEDVLREYVRGVKLATPMTANDMVEWKNDGIPVPVIQELLTTRPGTAK